VKCNHCSKKAVIHYAEVVDGKIKKVDLCEECAAKIGLNIQSSFSVSDFLGGLTNESSVAGKNETVCGTCSMSYEEFKKKGRLGCSECYRIFNDDLKSVVDQIHHSLQHKGKIPEQSHDPSSKRKRVAELRNELKQAVEEENYEKAAYLRDQIKKLDPNK